MSTVAVVGAGTMGSGIAQLAAIAGHDVWLRDLDEAPLTRALDSVRTSMARMVRSERITQDAADDALGRIRTTTSTQEAVGEAGVVVEAVFERLDVKHAVFDEIVAHAPADALLGTNTSQLSITSIAAPYGDRAPLVVGMHFFNPPVMMRLVELVRGLRTSDEALARAVDFAEGLGKQVVVCRKDSPGFLTSRISAILRLECLRMLEEGLASAEDIDTAIKLAFNHPMGPLELGDFNGLDTYLDALSGLHRAHGERFAPTVGLRNMVSAGLLGRKAGAGFYSYDADGRRQESVS